VVSYEGNMGGGNIRVLEGLYYKKGESLTVGIIGVSHYSVQHTKFSHTS
jgi:hypothetical protein